MSQPPNISLLIRTCNSAKTLDELLNRMDFIVGDECVVVDSGSKDKTLEIAARHQAKIIKAEGAFNYSKSLNLGFQAAKNTWVVVISSHCLPVVPDFLGQYRAAAMELPAEVMVIYAPSSLSGRSLLTEADKGLRLYQPADYQRVSYVCGNGNTLYRRQAWAELPFDETIRTAEDKLWLEAAFQRGWRFGYLPGARGRNQNQASLAYMFRKGRSDARAIPRHQPMPYRYLLGALKNHTLTGIRDRIGFGNWIRYTAHIFGQFFGSRDPEDNQP